MKRSLCSEPDRVWALRYIREANVDLSLTDGLKTPETIVELVALALKKAQLAIQHALGQPEYLELAVAQAALGKTEPADPPVRILLRMREIARNLSEVEELVRKETVLEAAEIVVSAAESVVKELTG